MFLKTNELKKMMKSALKSADGLRVGNLNEMYVIQTGYWGLQTEIACATNKFLAAIVELIGDIPTGGEHARYWIENKEVKMESLCEDPGIYARWIAAKDYAIETPVFVGSFPHEYRIYQTHNNSQYVFIRREWASDLFGSKELVSGVERMPGRPSCSHNGTVLYWKNDTTLYWACKAQFTEKVENSLIQALGVLDFSQDDWIAVKEPKIVTENDSNGEQLIPY